MREAYDEGLSDGPAFSPSVRLAGWDRPMESLSGKCYCGAVEYRVADEFLYAANCHCSNCRRTTGSAFKPFGGIERGKLEVTDGADKLLIVGEGGLHDAHCGGRGAMGFSVVRKGQDGLAGARTLAAAPRLRPPAP